MSRLFDNASSQYLYVDVAAITTLPCTIAGWCYIDEDANNSTIFSIADSSVGNKYYSIGAGFNRTSDTAYCIYVNTNYRIADSTSSMSLNGWHHVCGVFASTSSRKVYLDGNNVGEETTTTADPASTFDKMGIGVAIDLDKSDYASGRVAEVGIWNKILSLTEISNLFTDKYAPSMIAASSLKGYWPLIDDDNDNSGNNYNMTSSGGPTYTTHVSGIIYPNFPPIGVGIICD